jgi:hypothetical protein
MGKYTKKEKEPLVMQPVRFERRAINEVAEIHNNFSEFVRDAVDAHIKACNESTRLIS